MTRDQRISLSDLADKLTVRVRTDLLTGLMRDKTPGFYTERDGGDWYIVVPDHCDRLGEGFSDRNDAKSCLLWLAGVIDKPKGWEIRDRRGDLACDLDVDKDYPATIWLRAVKAHFPDAAAQIMTEDHPND